MKKKNLNIPVIAISAVAVCLVAVVAALAVKAGSKPPVEAEITGNVVENSNYYDNNYMTAPEESTSPFEVIVNTTAKILTNAYVPSTQSSTKAEAQTKPSTTAKPEEVTVPQLDPDEMSHASGSSATAVTPSGDLPNDMSFAGLRRMGYDVIGTKDYIYNNDKDPECMQKNFGYNKLYDAGASLIDFSIDTTRIEFKYGSKEYMIQLWKGQYISGKLGTVGGEIGVYTRPKGTVSAIGHYSCAEKEDWLNMEMTCFWDEQGNGEYLPQFTRNYTEYWWATGFVDGQLADRNNSDPLRILGRITFKDEEMAQNFVAAMSKKGFTQVSEFSPEVIDTYKIYGKDVIFLWQNVR